MLAKHDTLLIADEVVTGFGRLGSMFGSDHYGMAPDIITCAKGLTSAYALLSGSTPTQAKKPFSEACQALLDLCILIDSAAWSFLPMRRLICGSSALPLATKIVGDGRIYNNMQRPDLSNDFLPPLPQQAVEKAFRSGLARKSFSIY